MKRQTLTYRIHDISPYINWTYFFHAWGFEPIFARLSQLHLYPARLQSWLQSFSYDQREKAHAALELYNEAIHTLDKLDATQYYTMGRYGLFEAESDKDDIRIYDEGRIITFPFLRQQHNVGGKPNLCLSDFIRPYSQTNLHKDTIGVFATTAPINSESENSAAKLTEQLLMQTLYDRLAEATAEKMHKEIREKYWAYAPNENLSIEELHLEKFQGIRPAVGYPSLPDQSVVFLIDELLSLSSIGIKLTENGAMIPHATVCGLMFSHPQACYFNIGHIGQDQLEDYARRRNMPVNAMRKFLASNL